MSSLQEVSAVVGAFTTVQCLNLRSTGVRCTNLVSGDVTTNTIECSTLVSSGNISADTLTVETKVTTNQFQLIPAVPSLGYTLTSSDIAGNATWTAPLADYPNYKQKTTLLNHQFTFRN